MSINQLLSRRHFIKVAGAAAAATAAWLAQVFPDFALGSAGKAGKRPMARVPGAPDVPPWTWGAVTGKRELKASELHGALAVIQQRGSAPAAAAAAGFSLEGTHVGTAHYSVADGSTVLATAWVSGNRVLASYEIESPNRGRQSHALLYEVSSDFKGSLIAAAVDGKALTRSSHGATNPSAAAPLGAIADAEAGWCSICCYVDFGCIMPCCDYCFWPCLGGPAACVACALWWCSETCPLAICCNCFCDCGNAWGCGCCA